MSEGDGECIALAIEIGSGILVDERCIETDEPVAWYLDGVNGVRYTWGRIDEAPVDVEQESADLLLRIPDVEGITTFFVSESNQDVPPTITFQVDDQEIARITAVD